MRRMLPLLPLLLLATPVAGAGQTVAPADNARLTALFDADQHDRTPPAGQAIDWSKVGPADIVRQTETRAMLDAGTVRSGTDYWHAAFIFQHEDKPNDFLLAHTLAMTAMARGRPDAGWIAAATLDRYLRNIGKPQVYGTQFVWQGNSPTTQEPYDRALIGDAQRRAVGVPVLAEQEARRRELDAEHAKVPPRP